MKALIINDTPLKKHPFGRLLIESLEKNKIEVLLATSDENLEKPIFDFTNSMKSYLRLKSKLKRFKHIFLIYLYLRVHKFWSRVMNRFLWRKIVHLKSIIKISKLNADVVILIRANTLFSLIFFYLKNYGKKIKYYYLPYEIYGKQTVRSSIVLRLIEKICIKFLFEFVITQSNYRARYYQTINKNIKVIICRNFKKFNQNSVLFKSSSGKINLIYLGLIVHGRSLGTLIKSLDFLPANYRLTFVGPSPDGWLNTNKNLIQFYSSQNRFEIKNKISEDCINSLLSSFDIGLISYNDSCLNNLLCCPAKLTDYLHAGLTVVAPNIPGMQELASINNDIQLFEYGSPESLAKIIVKVNECDRSRNDIIENSQKLSWDLEFQNIFSSLINDN